MVNSKQIKDTNLIIKHTIKSNDAATAMQGACKHLKQKGIKVSELIDLDISQKSGMYNVRMIYGVRR